MAGGNTKKEFLQVYNFVPLAEKRAERYECQEERTGVITYSITTKTPLFIPNSSSEQAFQMEKSVPLEHKSYDFYSYREMEADKKYDGSPEKPVLPGSELRGMIRGIYETLTDSCMGVLNEEEVPSLRTAEIFRAGLLHRDGKNRWELVKANKYRYCKGGDKSRRTFEETRYPEGKKLYYRKVPFGESMITECKEKPEGKFTYEGYLIKGMGDRSLEKKHSAGIFQVKYKKDGLKKTLQVERKLTDTDIERLRAVLKSYREQPEAEENCYQEYQEQLEEFLAGNGEEFFPVYYSAADETLLYLAPACITRELSQYSIGKLAGDFAPCKSAETMCPACDLFGRVGESNEDSHASRLRFTDAYPEQDMEAEAYYESVQPITLENLAEPKIAATEFYLYRPEQSEGETKKEASFWTYDYYILDGNLYPAMGRLRGRKYYWHQPDVKLAEGIEKTKLNKTIRPVKGKVTFTGKVYFDKISKLQLDQMIWILNCGADNSDLAYKLGAGKPLGLGSVECKVTEVTEREVGIENGKIFYREKRYSPDLLDYEALRFSQHCKKEFLLMSSFHAAKEAAQISYPVTEEQFGKPVEEGFKWFVQNRQTGRTTTTGEKPAANKKVNSRKKMIIHESLPLAIRAECLPCGIREKVSPKEEEKGLLTAAVTGYKQGKNGRIAYLQLKIAGVGNRTIQCYKIKQKEPVPDNGWEASFPIGSKIQVKKTGQVQGKDGRMYDDLQYIGKIS